MGKIVITGGQGFLGRNLTEHMVSLGEDVCSTYSYTPPVSNAKSNLSYFKLDVTKFDDCLKLINQENPKIIYHFVAQPLVTAAQRHPFPTLELTIRGAYNLLEAVRQSGSDTSVIVYTTDKVYGENGNAIEGDRIDLVTGVYDTAKSCEDMISQMYAKLGMSVVVLRSANLYGKYDLHWDRIVPHVCKEIFHDRNPVLRSNGKQYRDYIYVDDIIDGIMISSNALVSGKILSGSIINFGAEKPHTSLEIVNMLLSVSNKNDLIPNILNTASGELSYQHINYGFAKSLGWNPKTDIMDGLDETYRWYKDWFSK